MSAQPRYSIIDLGAVPAPGQPFEIANNGLTGGGIGRSDGTEHAMLWYTGLGLKQDIGRPGLGGPNSVTYAVNQSGQASGGAQTGG